MADSGDDGERDTTMPTEDPTEGQAETKGEAEREEGQDGVTDASESPNAGGEDGEAEGGSPTHDDDADGAGAGDDGGAEGDKGSAEGQESASAPDDGDASPDDGGAADASPSDDGAVATADPEPDDGRGDGDDGDDGAADESGELDAPAPAQDADAGSGGADAGEQPEGEAPADAPASQDAPEKSQGEAQDEYSVSPPESNTLRENGESDGRADEGAPAPEEDDAEHEGAAAAAAEAEPEDREWEETTPFTDATHVVLPDGWKRLWVDDGKKLRFCDLSTGEVRDEPPNQPPKPAAPRSAPANPARSIMSPATKAQMDAEAAKLSLLESLQRARFDLSKIDLSRFQEPVKIEVQHPKEPLGISVRDSTRGDTLLPGAIVTHILPGSSASRHPEISVGDLIVSLDSKSVVGLGFATVLKMLQRSSKKSVTQFEIVPAQKVFEHKIRNDEQQDLGLELEGNFVRNVRAGSPAEKYGLVGHYIISVGDMPVSAMSTEDIQETLRGMYGSFSLVSMPKAVFEAQRLGRGKVHHTVADTVTDKLRRAGGSMYGSIKKAVADYRAKSPSSASTARARSPTAGAKSPPPAAAGDSAGASDNPAPAKAKAPAKGKPAVAKAEGEGKPAGQAKPAAAKGGANAKPATAKAKGKPAAAKAEAEGKPAGKAKPSAAKAAAVGKAAEPEAKADGGEADAAGASGSAGSEAQVVDSTPI